jgi:UDP-N-acetylmuramoyl-tripeptide--D-alanyl-D-alanine ligase
VLAGQADDADVRLLDERVTPEFRYAATISAAGRELEVETRLVGAHWGPAVALALAGAVALGGDPRRVANAIATAEPARERLEPVVMPTGGTLLVDTRKATPATLAPALEALAGVPAIRRIAVVGSLAYFDAPEEQAYADAARAARAVADEVVLYGPHAHLGASALRGDAHVTAFTSISELAAWIREATGPGDVVLVKGTYPYDHLYRVVLQFTHDVQCWSDDCRRRLDCLRCPRLGPPRSAATAEESTSA